MGFAAPSAAPSSEFLRGFLGQALYLALDLQPTHPSAIALTRTLVDQIIKAEVRKNRRQEAGHTKLERAVGAIIGGLLCAWGHQNGPRPVWHSNQADAFTPGTQRTQLPNRDQILDASGALTEAEERPPAVGRQTFKTVIRFLKTQGMIHHQRGVRRFSHTLSRMGEGDQGRSARYWPTEVLLRLAVASGLTPQNIAVAFQPPILLRPPVLLKPMDDHSKRRRRYATARHVVRAHDRYCLTVEPCPSGLIEEVRAQNALAAAIRVTPPPGIACHPPRWTRIFIGSWRLHGRWYPHGDDQDRVAGHAGTYMTLKAAQRGSIRIGDEPVVELDVSASHLTLFLGLMGAALPKSDLYEGLGYPRVVIKRWILEVFGKGRIPTRWSDAFAMNVLAQKHPIEQVTRAVIRRFRVLEHPRQVVPKELLDRFAPYAARLVTHYLTAQEAEAMTQAMRLLRAQSILALPVHDSLIVPASAEVAAREAITAGYQAVCGLVPRVKDKKQARPVPEKVTERELVRASRPRRR
ncbi:hypothetical protein MHZ93_19935 [Roseomonas sp. ACRSG]|nr:hypothetical protein [Roseomonas sp. ACRSG]